MPLLNNWNAKVPVIVVSDTNILSSLAGETPFRAANAGHRNVGAPLVGACDEWHWMH
jgi:hypothetical protein